MMLGYLLARAGVDLVVLEGMGHNLPLCWVRLEKPSAVDSRKTA